MMKLNQEVLRELLDYDSETGILTWTKRSIRWFNGCRNPDHQCRSWNTRNSGKRAGTIVSDKAGYSRRAITLFGRYYNEHKIIWLWVTGSWCDNEIDHINRNATDNRWENLKEATSADNSRNVSMSSRNTSGVVGVSWRSSVGRWVASCMFGGQRHHLGYFEDLKEAEKAVKKFRQSKNFSEGHGLPAPYRSAQEILT